MSGKILHKRSLTPDSIPTTSSLDTGELAINVNDGKIYLRRSGSSNDDVVPVVVANTVTNGDITLFGNQTITGSLFITGSQFEMFNNIIINSTTRRLNSGSTLSVDWGTRILHTNGNAISVDWQNRQLRSSIGISADWNNYYLADTATSTSVDWNNRILYTPNNIIALTWGDDTTNFANTYLYRLHNASSQNAFSQTYQYSGEVINAAVSSSASQYKLVYLAGDIWLPVNQNTDTSTRMLGIALAVFEDPKKGAVLLEGDISYDGTDGPTIHPTITTTDLGKPVYIRDNANDGYMSITPPTSGYVRIVGHVYYEKDGNYIFKFKPSNDWYKLS